MVVKAILLHLSQFYVYCAANWTSPFLRRRGNQSLIATILVSIYFRIQAGILHLCSTVVNCGELASPRNGSREGSRTTFPNTLTFACDPGFLLNGSSSRTCQPNGSWSGQKTTCVGRCVRSPRWSDQLLGSPRPLETGRDFGERISFQSLTVGYK